MLQLQRDLLDAYPDLLTLQAGGATSLTDAASAVQTAISEYTAAHATIAASIDGGDWRTDHLFNFYDLAEVNESAFYANQMEEIRLSIDEDRAATLTSTEERWDLTDSFGLGWIIEWEKDQEKQPDRRRMAFIFLWI